MEEQLVLLLADCVSRGFHRMPDGCGDILCGPRLILAA
jgi:hypothetical protein